MTVHRPLVGVFAFLSAGIFLGQSWASSLVILTILTFLSVIAGLLLIRRKILCAVFIGIAFVFLGILLVHSGKLLPKNHIFYIAKYYRRDPVFLEGIIVSDVQKRESFRGKKTTFTLEVKRLKTRWGWKKKGGKVLVNIFREVPLSYGDFVILEGKMYRPFNFSKDEKFTYRDYLDRRGIKFIVSVKKDGYAEVLESNRGNFFQAVSLKVKDRLGKLFREHLPRPQADLMQAMVLGDRYNLPKHLTDLFIQTGTAHILAISGQNVAIVAFMIFLVLKATFLPRRWQYILTILFVVFYAFLTGAQPSVVRAAIMASVFLLSFLTQRETDSINSLSLAAIVLLIFNPMNLFDIGFQLSFICVLAILVYYPRIMHFYPKTPRYLRSKWVLFIAQSLVISLAAWLGVAGLIAYYFNIITPITILANLIVVPCMSAIMALGFGLLGAGLVLPGMAFIFADCLNLVLNLMVGSIYLLSKAPVAYIHLINVSLWETGGYYAAVILLTVLLIRLTKRMNYDTVDAIT